MKVFISWSGDRSKSVALALRNWLPDVIQDVSPWMSAADIDAGARWGNNVQAQLSESKFGILCVTAENQSSPWLLFEAGALAKTVDDTFVCPYLIGLEPSELTPGPLTQFQAKVAREDDSRELIKTLNRAALSEALPNEKVERAFDRWWPDLKSTLDTLPAAKAPKPRRSQIEMVQEILVETRDIKRLLQEGSAANEYVDFLSRSFSHSLLGAKGLLPREYSHPPQVYREALMEALMGSKLDPRHSPEPAQSRDGAAEEEQDPPTASGAVEGRSENA